MTVCYAAWSSNPHVCPCVKLTSDKYQIISISNKNTFFWNHMLLKGLELLDDVRIHPVEG